MILNENATFYDILELTPDASPQELRAAYLRAKSAYKKDSVALYTLISEEETEELLQQIEEAYEVLSNPERRRAYDRNHGLIAVENEVTPPKRQVENKIVSIDRVPPMEPVINDDDILVPPTTDFTNAKRADSYESTNPALTIPPPAPAPAETKAKPLPPTPLMHSTDPEKDKALEEDIKQETEWRGIFLRKVREAKRSSLEEVSEYTKISKSYLQAIEEDNYPKLPAPVYLRGFVTQIAKFLKLPHDKVATAYMARYNQMRSNK